MKVYTGESREKSWSIQLIAHRSPYRHPFLAAVDSDTGEVIAPLIEFKENGDIVKQIEAKKGLEMQGYDPHEHGNSWVNGGQLHVIDYWNSTRQEGGTPYEISPEDVRLKKEDKERPRFTTD